jgi:hypothetical protein
MRLPLFVHLVNFVVESCQQLMNAGLQNGLVSPACLFHTADPVNSWRMLVLPTLNMSLGDLAQADPLTWYWTTPEQLFAKEAVNENYLAGSVLHSCLVGELFPKLLTKREKFQRFMTGRVGLFPNLSKAITSALPGTFTEEGEKLYKFISASLTPQGSSHLDHEQTQQYLQQLADELSAYRLALRWEYEGQPDVALELLCNYAESVAPQNMPWGTIARLKEKAHDLDGTLDAMLKALQFKESDAVRNAINYLYRVAAVYAGLENELFFEAAFNKIDYALPDMIDERFALQLAYLEVRYLKSDERALLRLERNFHEPWHQVLKLLIKARIVNFQKAFPSVSKLCKQGIGILSKMPGKGGDDVRYAISYFLILNGIAHVGAVGRFDDPSYLIDAFSHFARALDQAVEIQENELFNTGAHWLAWLENYAVLFPPRICQTLMTGIKAYLEIKKIAGFEISVFFDEIPSLPWYKEELFFHS